MYGRDAPSLGQVLARAAVERPEMPFLSDTFGTTLNFVEFERIVCQAAGWLQEIGVGNGDRVCSIASNSISWFALTFGAWRLGATVVPLNHELRGRMLAAMIVDSDSTAIFADDDGDKALQSIDSSNSPPRDKVFALHKLREHQGPGVPPGEFDPEAPALILFSSGTTGVSKGCVLSHEYLTWCGEEFSRAGDLTPADSVFTSGPFFHINAWWAFAGSIVTGIHHTFDVRFSASHFWERAAKAEATIFDYVGVMISILLRRTEPLPAELKLRAGLGGAARPDEIELFRQRFGIALLECYGLTECCLPIFQRESEFRPGSIGKASEYFDARLVDSERNEVPDGQLGELWLKPLQRRVIFSGYFQRDNLTSAAFDGPWFKTGDICRRDREGYYYYVDRKRHFIRRRGENISPFEVEGTIFEHPDVANCAIIGVPAEIGDEDVLLAVQPRTGSTINPTELFYWCADRLAAHLVPRYIRVMELPLTPSERVEKQKLRDEGVTPDTFDAEQSGLSARHRKS
ncbi:MAG: AMP-binding protein [Rhizobiaceae bacterium]|nr:AMP-binding protein [Rhizobiaceae bacterium]